MHHTRFGSNIDCLSGFHITWDISDNLHLGSNRQRDTRIDLKSASSNMWEHAWKWRVCWPDTDLQLIPFLRFNFTWWSDRTTPCAWVSIDLQLNFTQQSNTIQLLLTKGYLWKGWAPASITGIWISQVHLWRGTWNLRKSGFITSWTMWLMMKRTQLP